MTDVKCPYCDHEQEINHDDGYGYEEGERHSQECTYCREWFNYTTSISYSYSVYCSQKHGHELENTYKDLRYCKNCDYYGVR